MADYHVLDVNPLTQVGEILEQIDHRLYTIYPGDPQGSVVGSTIGQLCYDSSTGAYYKCVATDGTVGGTTWEIFSTSPASESDAGIIQIASNAEVAAGTNPSKAVVPLTLANNYLSKSGNLSGLANLVTSRANLGLGTMAVQNHTAVNIDGGAIDGTTIGDDVPAYGTFAGLASIVEVTPDVTFDPSVTSASENNPGWSLSNVAVDVSYFYNTSPGDGTITWTLENLEADEYYLCTFTYNKQTPFVDAQFTTLIDNVPQAVVRVNGSETGSTFAIKVLLKHNNPGQFGLRIRDINGGGMGSVIVRDIQVRKLLTTQKAQLFLTDDATSTTHEVRVAGDAVFIGQHAGFLSSEYGGTDYSSVGIGALALSGQTIMSQGNVAVGSFAGQYAQGARNVLVGSGSGMRLHRGDNNVFIGEGVGGSTAWNSVLIGDQVLGRGSTGFVSSSVVVGTRLLGDGTSELTNSVLIGNNLHKASVMKNMLLIGHQVLPDVTTVSDSIAVGHSIYNGSSTLTNVENCVLLGRTLLVTQTGTSLHNTVILGNNIGGYSGSTPDGIVHIGTYDTPTTIGAQHGAVVIGKNAGYNSGGGTGLNRSVVIGKDALLSSPYAHSYSVVIGHGAGALSSGAHDSSVVIGQAAGYQSRGVQNVFIGASVGQNNAGSGNVFVGGSLGGGSHSNKAVFGHSSITNTYLFGVLTMNSVYTPSGTADTTYEPGTVTFDDNYLYIRTPSAGFKRVALTSF